MILPVRPEGIVPEKPTPTLPKGAVASVAGSVGGPAVTQRPSAEHRRGAVQQLRRIVSRLKKLP
ncbi:MAG: hypothetical protein LYZ69_04700 [Nitrososphaerales archaeon]|nr:hypothetical protein [Nitrososphaerales archaeon]